jgi:RNA polymerase II-associated factor 1
MAAPNPRPERNVHQEYIARQRYSNALPPPELPPKLLNIPHRGPEYYTSAAFAESLLQHEPLNIDADAFGGMTIDIVGMPGIFDGDESCKFSCRLLLPHVC